MILPRPKVALVGHPNCGKTALFNALTGGRGKVGNYAGVTVERKTGCATTPRGRILCVLDLPGIYRLDPDRSRSAPDRTLDETITWEVLFGQHGEESPPDLVLAVVDATNLERTLGFVLELQENFPERPIILVLNMMDLGRKRGLELDLECLAQDLNVAIIPTVATRRAGLDLLLNQIDLEITREQNRRYGGELSSARASLPDQIRRRFASVDQILARAVRTPLHGPNRSDTIDAVILHPLWGSFILAFVFAVMFQLIFSVAERPMGWIKTAVSQLAMTLVKILPPGPVVNLLTDGVLAGVGSVLVFLPQILLLFAFLHLLEASGYLPRAAFLVDRLMGRMGLHGRAFIPLLSSFACAIPGILATRTIQNRKDRLATILVAPLMTCSARLPVYSLLVGAFIADRMIGGWIHLQGLVMFGLYLGGIVMAILVAAILRLTLLPGMQPPLILELPSYKWPELQGCLREMKDRALSFVQQAGTVILTLSILMWFLASYPRPAVSSLDPPIYSSYAGRMGRALEPLVAPIGFNWQIAIALIPSFLAREVMVGSLATVYAVTAHSVGMTAPNLKPWEEHHGEESGQFAPSGLDATASEATDDLQWLLGHRLAHEWSLATALSLLVWYVLACQCFSTLAVTRRETGSWKWPAFMLGYMTLLAYAGSWVTYHWASSWGVT